jgi:hypothetical protein
VFVGNRNLQGVRAKGGLALTVSQDTVKEIQKHLTFSHSLACVSLWFLYIIIITFEFFYTFISPLFFWVNFRAIFPKDIVLWMG